MGDRRPAPHLRTSRHGRLLRQRRAAAAPRAARQAGRRRRHRAARGRHHRQLRGAPLRRLLGDAGRAGAAAAVPTRSSSRRTSRPTARRSRDVMAVLREHVERVEVRRARRGLPRPDRLRAAEGRRAPRQGGRRGRAPGSAARSGSGPSKLVAKVASDAEKPDGFVVLSAEQARERFAGSPPGLIPGIGPKTAERLERQGIATLGALRRDCRTPSSATGSARASGPGSAAWPASRTIATSRRCAWPSPSRARPPSTATCAAWAELEPHLRRLTEQLCETLERQDQRGRTIGIKVRYDDFSTVTRARSIAAAGERAGRRVDGRGRAAAPARPAAPGAPARRARRGPRRGARGGREPPIS